MFNQTSKWRCHCCNNVYIPPVVYFRPMHCQESKPKQYSSSVTISATTVEESGRLLSCYALLLTILLFLFPQDVKVRKVGKHFISITFCVRPPSPPFIVPYALHPSIDPCVRNTKMAFYALSSHAVPETYIVQTSSNIVIWHKEGGSGLWERGVAMWSPSLFAIINICTSTITAFHSAPLLVIPYLGEWRSDISRLAGLGPAQVWRMWQVGHVLFADLTDGLPAGLHTSNGNLYFLPAEVVELGKVEHNAEPTHCKHEH